MLTLMLNFLGVLKALQLYSGTVLVLGECTVKDHDVSNFFQMIPGREVLACPEGRIKET